MAILTETDWGADWRAAQAQRGHRDDPERWNKRAPTFGRVRGRSPYVGELIRLMGAQPGDVVFDMGCGNGAVAIPLAEAGVRVVARDFSAGMLAGLSTQAAEFGVENLIDAGLMSWEDDWEACGILPRSADIALSSRSLITKDLAASLAKLTGVARRFAVATLSTGYTPMMSPTMLRELGVTAVNANDYQYAFNILVQQGYTPEVRYIVHDRVFAFDDADAAEALIGEMLEHATLYCDAAELEAAKPRVRAWVEERMIPNENAGVVNHHGEVEGAYKIVMRDDVRWAYLRWDV